MTLGTDKKGESLKRNSNTDQFQNYGLVNILIFPHIQRKTELRNSIFMYLIWRMQGTSKETETIRRTIRW